jgi:hypothetical protein
MYIYGCINACKSTKEGEEGVTAERNNLKIAVENLTSMYVLYVYICVYVHIYLFEI